MKAILLTIILMFTFQGCVSVEKEFESLCKRYELAMCGDIPIPEYNNASKYEIRAVMYDSPFEYKKDDGEQYDYLSGDILRGDCEDWAITFIENNLRQGNFKKGQVEWIFGKINGKGHAWTLVIINGETKLFDSGFKRGISIDKAYGDYGYKEKGIVYKY